MITKQYWIIFTPLKDTSLPWISREAIDEKYTNKQYEAIPFSNQMFINEINVIKDFFPSCVYDYNGNPTQDYKFVDVGCGIGTKVALAHELLKNFQCFGIEVTKQYVDIAKKLNGGIRIK